MFHYILLLYIQYFYCASVFVFVFVMCCNVHVKMHDSLLQTKSTYWYKEENLNLKYLEGYLQLQAYN